MLPLRLSELPPPPVVVNAILPTGLLIAPPVVSAPLFVKLRSPLDVLLHGPKARTTLALVSVVPPVDEPVRAPTVIAAVCDTVPPALRASAELALLPVIAALIAMLPAALSVSVVAVVQVIGALTVIAPVSPTEFGEPTVVRTTLLPVPPLPVLRAFWIVVLATVAGLAVGEMVSVGPADPVSVMLLSAAVTVRSVGSSSQVPGFPATALASTTALLAMASVCPEVSTHPPLPPLGPPLARIVPLNTVVPSDHTTTFPPLPLAVALASITAPALTVVFCALRTLASLPCAPPPILTVPPPAGPRALTCAVLARLTAPPVTIAAPPVCPGAPPDTSIVPASRAALPAPASIVTVPGPCGVVGAAICPEESMTFSRIPATASAVKRTVPPGASIVPVLETRLFTGLPSTPIGTAVTFGPTSKLMRPSP